MATTASLFSLTGKPFPYIGIGTPAAQLTTPIPSAEFVFNLFTGSGNTSITVAAAGEDQSILINCPLPRSFCWVLAELYFRITSVNADDWDQEALVNLQDDQSSPSTLIPIVARNENIFHTVTTILGRAYKAEVPSKLIVPLGILDGLLSVNVFNTTIDGAAGNLNFFARFLRYDRNQAQFWQVNTPVLIR